MLGSYCLLKYHLTRLNGVVMGDGVLLGAGERCFALIREFEGLRLKAYFCPARKLTIGYGHTGADVFSGKVISVAEAEELLVHDVAAFVPKVLALVHVPVSQGMLDALVSFAYNLGAGKLGSSTLLRRLNSGDFLGAADQFRVWNKAKVDGKMVVLPGLVKRREAERSVFLS